MIVLRAIGRFFARIGRWIKETAWIQPLLIVGGIFAIIFSIPYLTKWVKSWFTEESAAEKYYSSKKLSLTDAEKHKSEVDSIFDYLVSYSNGESEGIAKGEKKFGKKFFLTLVEEDCNACEERYDGFKTLEREWGRGSFDVFENDESFRLHTIFVDTKNDDGDSLFEDVYDRDVVLNFFEETNYAMAEEGHPYRDNTTESSYVTNLENLLDKDQISTPVVFLIDLTENAPEWTSKHGVREVLFSFSGTDGSDNYARARTLRNAWTNVEDKNNIFSTAYSK